jgi:hypothetical protein
MIKNEEEDKSKKQEIKQNSSLGNKPKLSYDEIYAKHKEENSRMLKKNLVSKFISNEVSPLEVKQADFINNIYGINEQQLNFNQIPYSQDEFVLHMNGLSGTDYLNKYLNQIPDESLNKLTNSSKMESGIDSKQKSIPSKNSPSEEIKFNQIKNEKFTKTNPTYLYKYVCNYEIQIENDKYFNVTKRLIGKKV